MTFLSLPILRTAAVTSAPVEPVLTMPLTLSSFLRRFTAVIMELSRLSLMASVGFSSGVITAGAWTISSLEES